MVVETIPHIIGFTAARKVTGIPVKFWKDHLYSLQADTFVTGGCMGGDAIIGKLLVQLFPEARHLVIVPANQYMVDYWWIPYQSSRTEIVVQWMPEGTTYKQRNQEIVNNSSELIGFPEYEEKDEKSKRSGTWQTIRMARSKPIGVTVHLTRETNNEL